MASLDSEDPFSILPNELLECIFHYLTVEDLCRIATCSRAWREATNSDILWRPLCRKKGWERHGTVTDLCKEIPFAAASQEQDTGQVSDSVSFPDDLLVNGSAWPGLVDTCKWKEVYMKARHLEANWLNNRYHVVSFEFGSDRPYWSAGNNTILPNLDGEGSSLAGGISNESVRIWDVTNGHCRHIINVNVSYERHALKMKNGVIAVGCQDGNIRTYSVQTGELLHVLSGHRKAVAVLFFDGETIVSVAEFGNRPNDVRVWNSADGSSRFVFTHSRQLVYLDYLDKTVAVAYGDDTIRLWDVWTGACKGTIVTGARLCLISCHLGDGFVISASMPNDIKMWNLDSGECMKTFEVSGVDFAIYPGWDAYICPCMFNGELLVVSPDFSAAMIFNLDGKFVGDIEFSGAELICIHGNKLVTTRALGGADYLWLIDRRDGFTLVKKLRHPLDDLFEETVDVDYTMAWMSDTKLAFVQYRDVEDDTNPRQIPKIFVHHYW